MTTGFATKPSLRRLALAVCVALTASSATAAILPTSSASLSDRNLFSVPYPSTYSKAALARAAKRTAEVVQIVPAKKSILVEACASSPSNPAVCQSLRYSTPIRETSPMMRAIVGSNNPTTVRIGYGKPTSATSDGLGTKNGTRLEDHGCLYVKTSLNF